VSRVRNDEAGFTLVELMVSSTLFLLVLGAALTSFGTMESKAGLNAKLQDTQQQARQTVIVLSRQLRNLAGPDENQPGAFDPATASFSPAAPYDIVFKTVDPNGPNAGLNPTNVERMRYCLDSGTPAKLWQQTQTWTTAAAPSPPSTSSCPDPAWPGTARVVADSVVNRYAGQDRPVFLYDSTDPSAIHTVRVNLWIDINPGKPPAQTNLQSGVFLRNQNQAPNASFQWSPGGAGHVVLNGSASDDPEGQQLSYTWKEGSIKLGTGIVFDWGPASTGTHTITLEVRDPAGLLGTASQDVTVS
jgi:prepilin-type N-terminal cleavage/methylation domain-containing protein